MMIEREKTCDNTCKHFDSFNGFCWVLWDYVSDGDRCKRK